VAVSDKIAAPVTPAAQSDKTTAPAADTVNEKAVAIAAVTLSDVAGAERYVEHSVATMQESLLTLDDALLATPWLLRLNRQSAWLFLDTLPLAQEGVTRVAPPPVADLAVLERLSDAQDPAAILRFAESRLGRLRFWLDLNCLAYQAAQALPQGQAGAQTILTETQALLQRLPGLERLAFSDGRPFADEQTLTWLNESGAQPVAPVAISAGPAKAVVLESEGLDVLGLASLVMAAGAEAEAARRLLDGALARLKTGGEQLLRAR
ncbi:MAG TPA: type VI secretion system domain-containing protein, partial [Alcaligenes sp.]|nr:type VI secretion system domain-containing protein [Alcaligenes sp.]HRL27850.1 type VI secretion system domain-containing protein [Alcaligenes sp.]